LKLISAGAGAACLVLARPVSFWRGLSCSVSFWRGLSRLEVEPKPDPTRHQARPDPTSSPTRPDIKPDPIPISQKKRRPEGRPKFSGLRFYA
jgi:hypothetical protein